MKLQSVCLLVLFAATVAAPRTAVCDEAGEIGVQIDLSVLPTPTTAMSDISLHIRLPNFGVHAESAFEPKVSFDNNSILVSVEYRLPPEYDQTFPIPIRIAPEETINLGRLSAGDYTVMASFPTSIGVIIGSASLSFSVVPEPSTAAMIGAASFGCCVFTRRRRL
jgi:hypothetical protein